MKRRLQSRLSPSNSSQLIRHRKGNVNHDNSLKLLKARHRLRSAVCFSLPAEIYLHDVGRRSRIVKPPRDEYKIHKDTLRDVVSLTRISDRRPTR